MFDAIVQELRQRFGLDAQAAPLVQGALAYIIKADHGGLAGFISKFEAAGLGQMAHSWMGGPDGAQTISPAQLETVLGNKGGLISQLVASTGLARQSVTPALGYLLPALVGVLTPQGSIPASLPPEVAAFAAGQSGSALGAIAGKTPVPTAEGAGAAMMRWIPWLVLVALALGVLGWCSQAPVSQDEALAGASSTMVAADQATAANAADAAATPASASTDAASAAAAELPALLASEAASAAAAAENASAAAGAAPDAAAANPAVSATAAPLGAGVLAEMAGDKPMLKIYFDVSRAQVAPEFAKVAADLVAYVKEHPEAKLSISGFNDPTGNAAQNAKLAKQRAQAVQSALKAQGIAANRMLLSKPADAAAAAAAGANNAELRRVEVRLQ